MRNFIVLIFLLLGLGLQAQVFLPGKLITIDGDTLVGLVAEQGGITWSFKESPKGAERIYTRRQVVGFERKDEKYEEHTFEVLRAKFPERVKDFLLVVEEGQVRLLRYDGKGLFGSDHVGYYIHENGMLTPLRVNLDDANFKVQMRQYFSDFPELASRIKAKELKYENIQEIVQIYNSWYSKQPHTDEITPAAKPTKAKKEPKAKKAHQIESDPLQGGVEESKEN
jgi:hypothetical protein